MPRTNRLILDPALTRGTVLDGRYRILGPIGSGGMGIVLEAENIALKRLVAIKVVADGGSKEARARLAREAELVAAIQHPNICGVLDVGALPNGGPYVVLERLIGGTLAAHLKTARVHPMREIIDIFLQILSGLQAAHAAPIVHRDLKPQNVFLATRVGCAPIVKILDFGFARNLLAKGKRITLPGKACGTTQYMSPEQLRAVSLDPRSDLFPVGAMLYEMLTGRHPFAGSSLVDVQTRILNSEPRQLRQRRRDVPPALEELVMSALSKDPARRPSSAYEMQCALWRVLQALPASETVEDEPPSVTTPMWIPSSSSPTP